MTFELDATGVSGPGVLIGSGAVDGTAPGSVVSLNIYCVLHGARPGDGVVQVVGNLSDGARQVTGAFSASNDSAFAGGSGTQPGQQVPAANGSLEIGSELYWTQGASDAASGNTYFVDAAPGAASFVPVGGNPDSNGDLKLLLGTATYTVKSSPPEGATQLYFFPHLRTDGDGTQRLNQRFLIGGVQYEPDGSGSNANMGVSNAFDVLPVTVLAPEPSMSALAAFGGMGLLIRRRRRG